MICKKIWQFKVFISFLFYGATHITIRDAPFARHISYIMGLKNIVYLFLNILLTVLDVDSMLRDALELTALEVEDAIVGLVGSDSADCIGIRLGNSHQNCTAKVS